MLGAWEPAYLSGQTAQNSEGLTCLKLRWAGPSVEG